MHYGHPPQNPEDILVNSVPEGEVVVNPANKQL
jgi:hypothetical protein